MLTEEPKPGQRCGTCLFGKCLEHMNKTEKDWVRCWFLPPANGVYPVISVNSVCAQWMDGKK